jgi:hypothetical protein
VEAETGATKTFYVHEAVLTSTSEFLKAALKKEWKEGQERIIYLNEMDPDRFELYLTWKYGGPIFEPPAEADNAMYHIPCSLVALGERIMDRQYQNRLVDGIYYCYQPTVFQAHRERWIDLLVQILPSVEVCLAYLRIYSSRLTCKTTHGGLLLPQRLAGVDS